MDGQILSLILALSKKQALKYGNTGIININANTTNDGITFELANGTKHDIKLNNLNLMKLSQYDKNNDGIVDFAEDSNKLGGKLANEYALKSEVSSNVNIKPFKNIIVLQEESNKVKIGISEFNMQIDELLVYQNGIYIEKNKEYKISLDGLYIEKISGNWNKDTIFNFVMYKGVKDKIEYEDGSLILNGSITFDKLNLDIQNRINNINNNNVERKTYEELTTLMADNKLETGGIYILTDYQTKYRILRTDEWCVGKTEELYLTATSTNTLSPIAYSKQYPQDIIYYDITLNETEGQQRTGFIIRREDTKTGNSAPFDFRTAQWARFRLHPTSYKFKGNIIPYDIMEIGGTVEEGRIYKVDNQLYLAYTTGAPTNMNDKRYLELLSNNIYEFWIEDYSGMYVYKLETQIIGDNTQIDLFNTFNDNSVHNRLEGFNNLSRCVFINSSYNTIEANCARLTFYNSNSNVLDTSCGDIIMQGSYSNKLGRFVANCIMLNGCSYNTIEGASTHIHLNMDSKSNTIGVNNSVINLISDCKNIQTEASCETIIFGYHCSEIVLSSRCINNGFGFGCRAINIGAQCENNNFGSSCYNIILGDSCSINTFTYACSNIELNTNCDLNSFQDSCNYIDLSVGCSGNKFDKQCSYVSLGNTNSQNTLGEQCKGITFSTACFNTTLGEYCSNIAMGNSCRDNKIGHHVTELQLASKSSNNTIGENCTLINIQTSSGSNIIPIGTKLLNIQGLKDKDLTTIPYLPNAFTKHITINGDNKPVMSYIKSDRTIETILIP